MRFGWNCDVGGEMRSVGACVGELLGGENGKYRDRGTAYL